MENNFSQYRYKKLSTLPKELKLKRAVEMREAAYSRDAVWVEQAKRAFAFTAGKQWSDTEIYVLETLQSREPMVFNHIHPTVQLIMGVLMQNPVRVYPSPVEKKDGFLCEIYEDIISWVDTNQAEAEFENHEAFEDAVISGKGFCGVDIYPDPKQPGQQVIIEEFHIPVHEVKIDPSCRRNNLKDANYIIWERWISVEQFKIRYPHKKNKIEEIFSLGGAGNDHLSAKIDSMGTLQTYSHVGDMRNAEEYDEPLSFDYYNSDSGKVLVCHMEYYEDYTRYFIKEQNQLIEIDKNKAKELEDAGLTVLREQDKKVKWLEYILDEILYDGDSPISETGFSIVPIFAYKDKSSSQISYYGVVKNMIDPQREINKRWMQAINLMANQGQGVTAEPDAFIDPIQAQESWSDPNQITWVKPGALTEGKIKEKPAIVFPDACMRMEDYAQETMKRVSGFNSDLLGQNTRSDPGIVIKLRQQQGMTILARLFEAYKRMKKELYERKLALVAKYMPNEQIKRIIGESDQYIIEGDIVVDKKNKLQANLHDIRNLGYNVKIEDGSGNMTKQMAELSIFVEMMSKGFPVDPLIVIEKLDISESMKSQWKDFVIKGIQSKQQGQQIEIQKTQMDFQLKAKEVQIKEQEAAAKAITEKLKIEQRQKEVEAIEDGKERDSMRDMFIALSKIEESKQGKALEIINKTIGK